MSQLVRESKYRHVFGQQGKKEYGYDNLKVTNSAWDTNVISASTRYVSLSWQSLGGGAFAILPLPSPFAPLPAGFPSKLPDLIPLARSHSGAVLDTDWSPFNDSVVASAGEDGKAMIWKVDASAFDGWGQDGWEPLDFDPVARIDVSPRRVGHVLFHPAAHNVLATSTGDHVVKLWDVACPESPGSVLGGHADAIQSVAFNAWGTLLVTTCGDRKIRIFDPRTGGDPVRVGEGHSGIKGTRVVWMGDKDRLATTGFSEMGDHQVALWETGSLSNVQTITVDQTSGVLMPFWTDNNILFLAGKGDGNIHSYEYGNDNLFPLAEYKSSNPQRGMCFLPRRGLSVSDCEVARALKVAANSIEAIAFIVPGKSDIFPPAPSAEPALTAAEFFSGKTPLPKLVEGDDGSVFSASGSGSAPTPASILAPAPTRTVFACAASAAPAPVIAVHEEPVPASRAEPTRSHTTPQNDSTISVLKEEDTMTDLSTEAPPDWLIHHPVLATRAISMKQAWWQTEGVWRTVEDAEGNWDAPCYVVRLLPPDSLEASLHELLASDGIAHPHVIPAEVFRDQRGDFLLMPALLDPFVIPRAWNTEQVLDFYHRVLQGIEDIHAAKVAHLDIHGGNVLTATSYEATRHAHVKAETIYLIDFGSSRLLTLGPGEEGPIELPPSAIPKFEDQPVFDPYAWDMYCVGILFKDPLQITTARGWQRHMLETYVGWIIGNEAKCTGICNCRPTAASARRVVKMMLVGLRVWRCLNGVGTRIYACVCMVLHLGRR